MGSILLRASLAAGLLVGLAACATRNTNLGPPPEQVVTGEELARNPSQPIEQVLQSKFPGVYVSKVNDGLVVEIRGPSSFYGDAAPLYVLDGSPMQAGPRGALAGVNPYDIETIRVLKNPADIGIYGMRGANGVILITTKRPGSPEP
jgi:TonB-dependent SusC/RagA subfamily outer membrane receptor